VYTLYTRYTVCIVCTAGLLLLLLSQLIPAAAPHLPLAALAAVLLAHIIFTPSMELLARLWTFDSKHNQLSTEIRVFVSKDNASRLLSGNAAEYSLSVNK
jgi:putative flippase GtrA